jgi:hypothetical protein
MKRPSKRVDVVEVIPITPAREFIRIWQSATSLAEVSKKVGRSKNACRVRAFRYREWYGIPLKEFPPVEFEPTNWDELARYAQEVEAGLATSSAGGQ